MSGKKRGGRGKGKAKPSTSESALHETRKKDAPKPAKSKDVARSGHTAFLKASTEHRPPEIIRGFNVIPKVKGGSLRRSFVTFYNRDVIGTDVAIYHTAGGTSSITTDRLIELKAEGNPEAKLYESKLKDWNLPSKMGRWTTSRSVVFNDNELRDAFKAAGVRFRDTGKAPLVPRVISLSSTSAEEVHMRDKFVDPLYKTMLGRRIVREWASAHVRKQARPVPITPTQWLDETLEIAGVTPPSVPVHFEDDNATTAYVPVIGTEPMSYTQPKATLQQTGCDDVTYHAMVLDYQAVLLKDTSPSAPERLAEVQALAGSFVYTAQTHIFGAGTASGAAGRVSRGLDISRSASKARTAARAPESEDFIGKSLILSAEDRLDALKKVLPIRDFSFWGKLAKVPDDPMDWFSFLKDVAGVQTHYNFLGLKYKDLQGVEHKLLEPLFSQNAMSDPGPPWGNKPAFMRYKNTAPPDAPKKRDTELQNKVLTSIVCRMVHNQTPADVRAALLGTFPAEFNKAADYRAHLDEHSTPDKIKLVPGSLSWLRITKIKQKPEFYDRVKADTRSRVICVPTPPFNIIPNEFFRPLKKVLLTQVSGAAEGISMLGWSPAHGGMKAFFDAARRTVENPDELFFTVYGDNLTVIENGNAIFCDASQMEASNSERGIRLLAQYVLTEFWGGTISDEGICTDGGRFSTWGANLMINAYPIAATNGIGVMQNTAFTWPGMLSGIGGTTEINTAEIGVVAIKLKEYYEKQHATRRAAGKPWKPALIAPNGEVNPNFVETFAKHGLIMKIEQRSHSAPFYAFKKVPRTLGGAPVLDDNGQQIFDDVPDRKLSRLKPITFASAEANPFTLDERGQEVPSKILGMYAYCIQLGPPGKKRLFYGAALEKDRAMKALVFSKAKAMLSGAGPNVTGAAGKMGLSENTISSVGRMISNASVAMMTIDPVLLEGFRLSNLRHAHLISRNVAPGSMGEAQMVMEMAEASFDMTRDFIGKDTMVNLRRESGFTDYAGVVQLLTQQHLPFYNTVRIMLSAAPATRVGSDLKPVKRTLACDLLVQEVLERNDLLPLVHRWLPSHIIAEILLQNPRLAESQGGPIPTATLERAKKIHETLESLYGLREAGDETYEGSDSDSSGEDDGVFPPDASRSVASWADADSDDSDQPGPSATGGPREHPDDARDTGGRAAPKRKPSSEEETEPRSKRPNVGNTTPSEPAELPVEPAAGHGQPVGRDIGQRGQGPVVAPGFVVEDEDL